MTDSDCRCLDEDDEEDIPGCPFCGECSQCGNCTCDSDWMA